MSLLNWQRSVEQIVVANKGFRVLGFTSVRRGAGVSLMCAHVAKTMAVNGMKTLVIALSEAFHGHSWVSADKPVTASALRAAIVQSKYGYDLLAGCDSEGRPIVSNIVQLRQLLDVEFSDYNRVIIDLPPISHVANDGLSTVAMSVICDRMLLVCAIGSDRKGEVSEAVALLNGAGATLSGVISNEYQRVDPMQTIISKFSNFRNKSGARHER